MKKVTIFRSSLVFVFIVLLLIGGNAMHKRRVVALLLLAALIFVVACAPQQPQTIIITEVVKVKVTATPIVYGVINCPECEGIALILWGSIDNIAGGGGKVYHGDECKIIDKGTTSGIPKFKLNCSGKVGWLRAEGVLRK